jgi:hypothetical protein
MSLNRITHAFLISVRPEDLSVDDPRLAPLGFPATLVTGFDFRGLPREKLSEYCDYERFRWRYGRYPLPGEIGCAAAHRFCYETLINEHGDLALIFEDDAIVTGEIEAAVSEAIRYLPSFDVISLKLTHGVYRRRPILTFPSGAIYRATFAQFGAHAYLISKKAASRFLMAQRPKISFLADWPLSGPIALSRSEFFGIDGQIVRLTNRPSTIMIDRSNVPDEFRKEVFNFRDIWRDICLKIRLWVFRDSIASYDGVSDVRWIR